MAHGLEVRPVFLDDEVVKFMLNMPGPARRHPKELLLQAINRFMPGELLADLKSRAKRTFTFPFARWLSTRFEAFARGDFFRRPVGRQGNPGSRGGEPNLATFPEFTRVGGLVAYLEFVCPRPLV